MSSRSQRKARSFLAKTEETIQVARQLFQSQFPSEDFDAVTWNMQPLIKRPGVRSTRNLYFTRLRLPDDPLPEPYASVIKSWLVLDGQSLDSRQHQLLAARYLWEALLQRTRSASNFHWQMLTLGDLHQTELRFLSIGEARHAYNKAICVQQLVRFLEARQICPPLHYKVRIPPPLSPFAHISQERAGKNNKLPSQRALEGLADIYRLAQEPADRLRMAAIALLVVTGFRIGELLTMPLDCEEEDVHQDQRRYGLRYYREKARAGTFVLDIRWLTPIGEQLARQAIAEIQSITEPFREQARRLEQDPTRVALAGYQGEDKLTSQDVQHLLGLKTRGGVNDIPPEDLPRYGPTWGRYFLAADVEAYLLARRPALWTLNRGDGSFQWLSQTLLIAPMNFFRMRTGANPYLIGPVPYNHISHFLLGDQSNFSVFKRFDIREADGSYCKMTTHQFRHWLNDLADKGGLSIDLQTRWFGRQNQQQTRAYHHATIEERLQWVKQGIRDGTIGGFLAEVYFSLPETDRDVFLEGQVQAVHVTALGLCLHDFSLDPCPYHLNCVCGCRDYLRTKGSQQERTNLIQIQKRTEQSLYMAQEAARTGKGMLAEAWIRHHQEILVGCQAALAIDDETSATPAGTLVHPFVKQHSKFQPL